MKLIVGLGNPGPQYAKTRHNVGRRLVETLAQRSRARWKQDKALRFHWTEAAESSASFFLALPDSFMNEIGEVVRSLVSFFKIDFHFDLLVVVDDVALPFGRLRLRAQGEDGGHRGLRSVEGALGSQEYARLRIGIKPSVPISTTLEEYVLSPFEKEEEKGLKEILERGITSCHLWVTSPIEKAMDWTNKPSS